MLAASDEAGRGPLAGPVVASTVAVFTRSLEGVKDCQEFITFLKEIGVSDSKKLSAKKRKYILEKVFPAKLCWDQFIIDLSQKHSPLLLLNNKDSRVMLDVSFKGPEMIDKINILNASLLAMQDSFINIKEYSPMLLAKNIHWWIDGNRLPKRAASMPNAQAVVAGDQKSLLIGLASIFAKELRDHHMQNLALLYPGYGLEKHAGYPTRLHLEAIKDLGPSIIHRKTFRGVKEFANEQ